MSAFDPKQPSQPALHTVSEWPHMGMGVLSRSAAHLKFAQFTVGIEDLALTWRARQLFTPADIDSCVSERVTKCASHCAANSSAGIARPCR